MTQDQQAHPPVPLAATAAPPGQAGRADSRTTHPVLPGVLLAVAVAVPATVIGEFLPLIGSPVSGVVLGVLAALLHRPGCRLRPGLTFAARGPLQLAIVLLGTGLSLATTVRVGVASLPVLLGTLAACLLCARLLGRRLGVPTDLRTLIGVGTGVCGASAIAAVTPVIGAATADVAYAMATVFVFNIAAVLTFPALGHLLGLGQHAFGLFAGTAVNDMSSVVATAGVYGSGAASYAVVVKLARTLMIIPICVALGRRRSAAAPARRLHVARLVPWFLVGFLLAATADTLHLVPAAAHPALGRTAGFLITVALSAVGLSTDPAGLRRAGPRPLLLGAGLWLVVSVTSLALQAGCGSL